MLIASKINNSTVVRYGKSGYIEIIFLFSFIFQNLPAQQNYRFDHLTTASGLSQNSVIKIYQDSRNFLWFGTYDGLNRYDGYTFKVYKTSISDSTTISGQQLNAICEDKNGNLWIGSMDAGLNKYIRETDSFKRYRYDPNNPNSLSNDHIRALFVDSKGNLWIATENGLNLFDSKTEKFIHYLNNPNDANSLVWNFVLSVAEDSSGNLWIGTWMGLSKYNPVTKHFTNYMKNRELSNHLYSNFIGKIFLDKKKNLWIGTGEGLHLYDSKNDTFIRYLPNDKDPNKWYDKGITDLLEDDRGNFWVSTFRGGLYIFDRKKGTFTGFKFDQYNKYSLNTNNISSLFQDKSGIIWIGTDGGGINKLVLRKAQFNISELEPSNKNSLSNNLVYSFFENKSGNIWISTFGGGLNKYTPEKDRYSFVHLTHNPKDTNSLIDDKTRCTIEDKNGNLWIGTESGLDKYDINKKSFRHYNYEQVDGLRNNAISSIVETSYGEIWVGTFNGGMCRYNPDKDNFTNFYPDSGNPGSVSSATVRKLYEDPSGIFWICTDKGLDRYDRVRKLFVHYLHDPKNPNSLSSNNILNIFKDKSGIYWVGTTLGLNKITGDLVNNKNVLYTHYTEKNGLPDHNIQGAVEDDKGNLWISTNKGISKFNPKKETFKNYTISDGLPSNEFYVNSFLTLEKTGNFLFGGDQGFCYFNPDSIMDDRYVPPVVFTDFSLFNQPVPTNESINGQVILTKSIWETNFIELTYKNNVISFEFSALDYASPSANSYAYKMEGLESCWNFVGNRHYASFTNLPPGEYMFRVKAANPSNVWNEKGAYIKIVVLPPYWQTWWFRLFTVLGILIAIFISYKVKVSGIEKRKKYLEKLIGEKSLLNERLQLEIKEHEDAEIELRKAKEEAEKSDKLKSEFLAQMSHEIRTPINAILSFSSLIKEDVADFISEDMKDGFSIIDRASKRLIRTVDLILNMSLLQTDSFELNFQPFDLYTNIIDTKIQEYSCSAEDKGLRFDVLKNTDDCYIYADDTTVEQIFDNLFNNAVKFTRQGIVGVHIFRDEMNRLVVEIYDTGIGISKEYMPNLFKPFSQEEGGYARRFEGNGLGLALAKKYCDLNNILIKVMSEKGYGSKFTLIFK